MRLLKLVVPKPGRLIQQPYTASIAVSRTSKELIGFNELRLSALGQKWDNPDYNSFSITHRPNH